MRQSFKHTLTVTLCTIMLCSSQTNSALSKIEGYAVGAACVGITYGLSRLCAWTAMQSAQNIFDQELNTPFHLYSQEESKRVIQDIILVRHDTECWRACYQAYPLLWYKNMLDECIGRLQFWHIVTIGTSQWNNMHCLIEQLKQLRTLVITNYLYISELRNFTHTQRHCYTLQVY